MNDRPWKGFWVDKGLKERWLERMNNIRGVQVEASCSGHRGRPAYLMYKCPKGDHDIVVALAHLRKVAQIIPVGGGHMSVQLLKPPAGGGFRRLSAKQWWNKVIGWLESWYGKRT